MSSALHPAALAERADWHVLFWVPAAAGVAVIALVRML